MQIEKYFDPKKMINISLLLLGELKRTNKFNVFDYYFAISNFNIELYSFPCG